MKPLLVRILLCLTAATTPLQSSIAQSNTPDLSDVTLVVGTAGPRFQATWDFSNPKAPYKVKFVAFDGSAPIVEALTAGAVDIGAPGDIGVIFAHASGAAVDIVGVQRSNPAFLRLIVPKGSPSKTLADLKGKTIAVTKATSSHMFILAAINAAGMKASDFKWAYLSNADAGTAFQRGNVDAWATWDPFAATAEIKWDASLITAGTPQTSGYAYWVAKPDLFKSGSAKAAAARDFIARYVGVNKNEFVNREQWTASLATALKLDGAIAKQVAEHYYFTSYPLTPEAKDAYTRSAKLLFEQGLLRTIPNPDKFFDFTSVNPAVSAAIAARDK